MKLGNPTGIAINKQNNADNLHKYQGSFFNFVFSLIYLDMVNLEYGYSNTYIDDIKINNKGVLSVSLNIKIRIHGISDSGKLCR